MHTVRIRTRGRRRFGAVPSPCAIVRRLHISHKFSHRGAGRRRRPLRARGARDRDARRTTEGGGTVEAMATTTDDPWSPRASPSPGLWPSVAGIAGRRGARRHLAADRTDRRSASSAPRRRRHPGRRRGRRPGPGRRALRPLPRRRLPRRCWPASRASSSVPSAWSSPATTSGGNAVNTIFVYFFVMALLRGLPAAVAKVFQSPKRRLPDAVPGPDRRALPHPPGARGWSPSGPRTAPPTASRSSGAASSPASVCRFDPATATGRRPRRRRALGAEAGHGRPGRPLARPPRPRWRRKRKAERRRQGGQGRRRPPTTTRPPPGAAPRRRPRGPRRRGPPASGRARSGEPPARRPPVT